MASSDAQKRASRNWEAKNPDKARHNMYKRKANKFINDCKSISDLEDVLSLIEEKKREADKDV